MKRIVSFCDCNSPDHQLIFEIDEGSHPDEPNGEIIYKDLLVYYKLTHYHSFFSRLKNAYKYLMQKDVDKIDYLDIIISRPEELEKLKSVIDEVIEFNTSVA